MGQPRVTPGCCAKAGGRLRKRCLVDCEGEFWIPDSGFSLIAKADSGFWVLADWEGGGRPQCSTHCSSLSPPMSSTEPSGRGPGSRSIDHVGIGTKVYAYPPPPPAPGRSYHPREAVRGGMGSCEGVLSGRSCHHSDGVSGWVRKLSGENFPGMYGRFWVRMVPLGCGPWRRAAEG